MINQQLTYLPTTPVICSHFTLGNPKSYFSTILFIHTSDYLHYLRIKRTVADGKTSIYLNILAKYERHLFTYCYKFLFHNNSIICNTTCSTATHVTSDMILICADVRCLG